MNARAIDIMHELEDTNTALQRARAELVTARKVMDAVADQRDAAIAERARYGDMMTERLGQCENERDAARAEAAALRETLRAVLDILKSGRSTGRKAIQALYAAEDVLMLALGK